jgi:hypothetical protein
LDSNYLNAIPFDVLQTVNGSLESVNLTLNSFAEVRSGDFPVMLHLKTLILDVCRIERITEVKKQKNYYLTKQNL